MPLEDVASALDVQISEIGDPHYDDPSLALLFSQLKSKTLQTAQGTSEISGRTEFNFVLQIARVFCRMGTPSPSLRTQQEHHAHTPPHPPQGATRSRSTSSVRGRSSGHRRSCATAARCCAALPARSRRASRSSLRSAASRRSLSTSTSHPRRRRAARPRRARPRVAAAATAGTPRRCAQ